MFRNIRRYVTLRAAVLSASLVCVLSLANSLSAKPPRGRVPVPRPGGGIYQPPQDTGAYSGRFSGKTAILVKSATGERQVDSFNMKEKLNLAWNLCSRKLERKIYGYLTQRTRDHRGGKVVERTNTGYKLYKVSVNLAPATSAARMSIAVSPQRKYVTLHYMVPGNRIQFKVDKNNLPDPKVTIVCDVMLTARFSTDGSAPDMIRLRSASVSIRNANVDIDGNILLDVIKKVAEFFRGKSFASDVERALNGRSSVITEDVAQQMALINRLLRKHTGGAHGMTPKFDRRQRQLELVIDKGPNVVRPLKVVPLKNTTRFRSR